jgi:hypothetical protein
MRRVRLDILDTKTFFYPWIQRQDQKQELKRRKVMNYNSQIVANCLIVTIEAKYDYLDTLIFVKELISECTMKKYDEVLIDARQLSGNADILHIFLFGELTSNSRTLKNKITILHRPKQFKDDFLKTVLSNKGILYKSADKEKELMQCLPEDMHGKATNYISQINGCSISGRG